MKISIITPSYNQAQFIEETMQSVLSQNGDFELEYIIIDGLSTDGSVDIIKRFAKTDKRIRFVCEKDEGQSDAINKGLQMATGDVIAWLNSDDVYKAGTLKKVAQVFADKSVHWAYGLVDIVDEHGKAIHGFAKWWRDTNARSYRSWKLHVLNFIAQPAVFWRRSFLKEVGNLNERLHYTMDYELWLRFSKLADPFVISEALAKFRRHNASKSNTSYNPKQFAEQYMVAQQFTRNHGLLLLHRLHNVATMIVYRLMKS